jgi:hypothetical protein
VGILQNTAIKKRYLGPFSGALKKCMIFTRSVLLFLQDASERTAAGSTII